ncbi:hypothetical protein SLEP1_g29592 [Rubroshorea leprosula]|uniref:Gnk2-homologous domain-containing protein n=1 Tax=Rubroshorea leprosula TaxID=152421 RepID=A0AAV5K347_9ROSI|nr:hypothetical protein SLEP1_g29592 [Rubroshorea leprosula]
MRRLKLCRRLKGLPQGRQIFLRFRPCTVWFQCMLYLSTLDCNRCLQGAIASLPNCCSGKVGGRILKPSCNIRHEVYPFYIESAVPAPAPSPVVLTLTPPPGSEIIPKGRGQRSWVIIVAIVVPVRVSILLFIAVYCLLTRRGRTKYDVVQGNNAENMTSFFNPKLSLWFHRFLLLYLVSGCAAVADITTIESLQYDLNSIEAATNNFADSNRIGEGGFGVVYKVMSMPGPENSI